MSDLSQYDYELPRELIAQAPLRNRSDARLLVVDRGRQQLDHLHVRDLPCLLGGEDALVLNDTRVVPARLVGVRTATGGHWEGLFLAVDDQGAWQILSKTRGKLVAGESVTLLDRQGQPDVELRLVFKESDGSWIVRPVSEEDSLSILERAGRVPLPPYIRKGQMQESDRQSYQTVYAEHSGAVAAPTAGLHFTDELLQRIAAAGTAICRVTLHVGLGTFRAIESETLDGHQMHSEWGRIDDQTVTRLSDCRRQGGRIVAVGTTSVRVLETAAQGGALAPFSGHTDLFIRPPYAFRAVDVLMTNFHLPRTTLLVLVRTFGGDELMRRAYEEAIREEYRFFSYGDAMIIL